MVNDNILYSFLPIPDYILKYFGLEKEILPIKIFEKDEPHLIDELDKKEKLKSSSFAFNKSFQENDYEGKYYEGNLKKLTKQQGDR